MTDARIDPVAAVPAPPASPDAAAAWRRALPALLIVLALIGVFFADTFRDMERIWARSDTFAHAYVVPPISLWLIWRLRAQLARQSPTPAAWLLVPFAAVALAWLAGELVAVNAATQLAATALVVLAVPLTLGWRVAGTMLFPLAFLFFAVPIGEFMVPPLMQLTADFTIFALRLSGIPVFREGLQFVIPSGNWSVVEACSGVRYLMASFMVGSLFAYLNYRSWRRRLVFAIVSLLVPILANWIRAYMIVMLGHLSGNQLAVGADHLVYGWVFFGVVITIVFMIGARWAEEPATPLAGDPGVRATGARPAWHAWGVAVAAAALVALPQLMLQRIDRAESDAPPRLALAEGRWAAGWTPVPAGADAFRPSFQNPSTEALVRYEQANLAPVGLYVAYYRGQGDSRKLVSSANQVVTSKDRDWNRVETRRRRVSLADGRGLEVLQSQLLGKGAVAAGLRPRMLAWQFYWINGNLTANDPLAKLLGAWHRLLGRGDEGAAVVIHALDTPERPAEAAMESFLRANLDPLQSALAATRASR